MGPGSGSAAPAARQVTRSPGLRSKVSLVLENLARAAEGRTLQGGGEAGLTRVISSRAWAEGARRRKGERVGAGGVRGFAERESEEQGEECLRDGGRARDLCPAASSEGRPVGGSVSLRGMGGPRRHCDVFPFRRAEDIG